MSTLMTSESYNELSDKLSELLTDLGTNYDCIDPTIIKLLDQAKDLSDSKITTAITEDQVIGFYNVSQHYLSAIINGDNSSLDDSDISLLDNWLGKLPDNITFVHTEESYFTRCEICSLHSDCVNLYVIKLSN